MTNRHFKWSVTYKIISESNRVMKGQLEELGEETDENVENISKMQGQILNMTGGKVNIFDASGDFKSTYEIMQGIAEVWDDLSSIDQADLLETIAGKNRANDVAALLSNWENVEAAVQSASAAEGSAAKENAKYVDSIQGRLDKMTTSWQSFANTFMSSDFLKGAISGLTNLIEGFEKLIETAGTFPTLLTTISAGVSLFKNKGVFRTLTSDLDGFLNKIGVAKKSFADLTNAFKFGKSGGGLKGGLSAIKNSLSGGLTKTDIANIQAYNKEIENGTSAQTAWYRTMQTSSDAAQSLVESAKGSKVAIDSVKTASIGGKVALLGMKTAALLMNAALTMGISLLIDFAISGIMKLVNAKEELAEKVDEVTSKFKEQHTELVKNKSSFESQATRYSQLAKGVNDLGENVSLTADEYAEYQDVVNSIAGQVPSLIQGYDAQGNAILSCKGNVEELTAAYEDLIKKQNDSILKGDSYKDIEKDFKNAMKDAKSADAGFMKTRASLNEINALEALLSSNDLDSLIPKISEKYGVNFSYLINELKSAGIKKKFGESYHEFIKRAVTQNKDIVQRVVNDFNANLDEEAEGMRTAAQAALSKAFDFSDSEYKDINDKTQSIIRQVVGNFDAEQFDKIVQSGKTVEEYINDMLDSFKSMSSGEATELEAAFDLQTKFNGGEISYGEYVKGLQDASNLINGLDLDENIKSQIKLSLGLSEKDGKWVLEEYETLLNRLTSEDYDIQLNTDSAESFLKNLSASEVQVAVDFIESDNADFKSALQNYKDVFDEAKEAGVDFSKTVFGNIDTNARQTLEWTSGNLKKYKDELMSWEPKNASWDKVKKEYEGAISTVMGTVSSYEIDGKEVDIAFSPMLQTDKGAEILSSGTVNTYISELISKATEDGKWSEKELIALDAKGLEVDGQKIKGILADIGETAQATGKQMHFVGKDGALALAEAEIDAIVKKQAELNDALNYTIAIDVETENIEALNTAMAESVSGAGLSSEAIAALKSRYAELEGEGYNLSAMFEETANGIHLNREAVGELEQKLASDKLAETDKQLEVLKGRYDELTTEIDNCTDASERAALYTEQQSIVDKINDLATLAAQYEGLTSAYNAWLAAEEAGSERDMYEGIIEGFETVGDEISRGWVDDGTIKFLELLTGKTGLAGKSGKELKEIYDDLDETIKNTTYSVRDFFTVDEDGNSTNTGVYNFLDAIGQLEEEKFGGKDIVKRDKDGNIISFDFELAAKKDKNGNVIKNGDQVIAEALGISEELVQIMVRASDDAGFVVNLEGAYTQLADLKTEAESARDTLISLQKNGLAKLKGVDVNFDLEAEGNDLLEEQGKSVELLNKFKDKNGKIDLKMEGAQQALDIAEYLTIKLDDLTEPKIMQIDVSEVDEDLRDPIEKMQEIVNLSKEKNLVSLTGDKKEIQETQNEINKVAKELEELDPEIKAQVGIDEDWDAKTIASKIEKGEVEIPAELELDVQMSDDLKDMRLMMMNQLGLVSDNEVKLKVGFDIDESVVDGLTDEQKEVVVKYLAEHEEVDDYTPEQKEALVKYIADGGNLDDYTPEEKQGIVKYLADGGDITDYTPEQKQAIVEYLTDSGDPDNWTPEQKEAVAKFKKDSAEVDNYSPEDKQAIAKFIKNSIEPDTYQPPNKTQNVTANLDSSEPDDYQPKDKKFTVKAVLQKIGDWTNKLLSGGSKRKMVNGTANVDGTALSNGTTGRAFKHGDWSTKDSGDALVGELGTETLVRNGRYYTIGDTGAEFIHYEKGDIIFNHKQTEELFRYGKVTSGGGRGRALASGTAFPNGSTGSSGSGGGLKVGGKSVEIKTDSVKVESKTSSTKSSSSSSKSSSKSKTSSSSSSSSKSKSEDTAEEFEETFDLIEIAISRIEREIDNLDQKANRTYKSWSSRNTALTKEISKVGDEIDLQEKAYNRYLKEANDVGLSSSWAAKVRNGQIDISTITDEALAEKIKSFQDYYEKALECEDAIEDLKDTEAELYAQRFENVQSQYDDILQGYEHTETMLNEYITQAETQGHIISKKYYDALINNEKQNISQLKKEQSALIAERDEAVADGKITKGSEAWYEQCAAIDEVTRSIEASETALLEYAKAIDEINWQKFDLVQERMSDVAAESEFLIDLMSNKDLYDDGGKLTDQGVATMGLYGLNYNTHMYQADEYGAEIAKLDAQIAKDPYDQELINRRRELVELQRESILAAEGEKDAIRDMVEEGINLELDALQKLIDKKNEELDSMKDLYDYQKKVSEQTEEIASLEKQMAAYSGDDSEETQSKIQELKVSLEEAKTDLEETEYDKFISDQSALLDELYLEYETILNSRLDNIDALLEQVIATINVTAGAEGAIATALGSEGALAGILGNNTTTIKDTLVSETSKVGTTLSQSMSSIWDAEGSGNKVITKYGDGFQGQQTTTNTVLGQIKTDVAAMVDDVDKDAQKKVTANKTSTSAKKNPTTTSTSNKNTNTNTNKNTNKTNSRSEKEYYGVALAIWNGNQGWGNIPPRKDRLKEKGFDYDKIMTIVNQMKKDGYIYSGAWAGKYHGIKDVTQYAYNKFEKGVQDLDRTQLAWTQEKGREFIVRPSDGAILTPVAKGDSVLNATASGNIWNMANSPAEFIKNNLGLDGANIPSSANVNNSVVQNFENVNFNMPNVHSYNELLREMQSDSKFEKLILAMTVDQIAGRSKLAKGKSIR